VGLLVAPRPSFGFFVKFGGFAGGRIAWRILFLGFADVYARFGAESGCVFVSTFWVR